VNLRGTVNVLGCAFVTLSSRQCAQNAIRSLHHSRTLEVSCCCLFGLIIVALLAS